MTVRIVSFGYGHGSAPEADLTLDVRRSLRNPHRDPAMRELTGQDHAVHDHVVTTPGAHRILSNLAWTLHDLVGDLGQASIAIGCVGGRHRSVALADALGSELQARGIAVEVTHRDISRPLLPPAAHIGGAR